jgi:hypothetical protein
MAHAEDPLVSIEDIALRWHTGIATVRALVADRSIESLDGGLLAQEGRTDVPVSRLSWAEEVRQDSPGAARRVDDELGGALHPAAQAAIRFFDAVRDGDADVVWAMSTPASHEIAVDEDDLYVEWLLALGDALDGHVGIATGVYSLEPYPGYGVRLVGDPPAVPERFDKATPVWPVGLLPLQEIEGQWLVDLPTATLDVEWFALLRTAPPGG